MSQPLIACLLEGIENQSWHSDAFAVNWRPRCLPYGEITSTSRTSEVAPVRLYREHYANTHVIKIFLSLDESNQAMTPEILALES